MLPFNREFLVRGEDGAEYGPAGLEELREWVQENRAGLGSLVQPVEPGATWAPWQNFPELVALLAETHADVPPPPPPMPGAVIIAPLFPRLVAGILDLILSNFLASPIIYVVFTLCVPNWSDQIFAFYFQPDHPLDPLMAHYLDISEVIYGAILIFYVAGFLAAHGQTPAKALLGLRVVGRDGGNPTFLRGLVRGVFFFLSIFLCGLPFVFIFLNPQRRALHDFAAETCVVKI